MRKLIWIAALLLVAIVLMGCGSSSVETQVKKETKVSASVDSTGSTSVKAKETVTENIYMEIPVTDGKDTSVREGGEIFINDYVPQIYRNKGSGVMKISIQRNTTTEKDSSQQADVKRDNTEKTKERSTTEEEHSSGHSGVIWLAVVGVLITGIGYAIYRKYLK